MKKIIFWIITILAFALILSSCIEKAEENTWFRVKRVDNNVNDIIKLNNNYKSGDKVKVTIDDTTCIVEILEQAIDSINTVIYTDKIQYIQLSDSLKKGDTIMMNKLDDTINLLKHNGELKNKYILK